MLGCGPSPWLQLQRAEPAAASIWLQPDADTNAFLTFALDSRRKCRASPCVSQLVAGWLSGTQHTRRKEVTQRKPEIAVPMDAWVSLSHPVPGACTAAVGVLPLRGSRCPAPACGGGVVGGMPQAPPPWARAHPPRALAARCPASCCLTLAPAAPPSSVHHSSHCTKYGKTADCAGRLQLACRACRGWRTWLVYWHA
jgi:hypothetical protein